VLNDRPEDVAVIVAVIIVGFSCCAVLSLLTSEEEKASLIHSVLAKLSTLQRLSSERSS
jgi:hypothetical protein